MLSDQIKEDIINISRDFLKHSDSTNVSIDEISDYILRIIFNIYEKKKYSKYIYSEMIQQIISEKFRFLNDTFKFNLTEESKNKLKKRVQKLRLKPQEEQRSQAWYDKRFNQIGASELASVFNKSPFCSFKKYRLKKIGIEKKTTIPFNIHCHHGVKYEEIATKLYMKKNNLKVMEFGSIDDEEFSFIAASPDGITEDGTMLEIKCPYSRKIVGIPPIYYWYQMQQQLKVCKLNCCDFLECEIKEYTSWYDFTQDNFEGNYVKNNFNLEKGVIIEYINKNAKEDRNLYGYVYPEKLDMSLDEIYKWNEIMKNKIEKDETKLYSKIIPWKLITYSCIRIYRNKLWWESNIDLIKEFWEDVLKGRHNKQDELLKIQEEIQKKELKKKMKLEKNKHCKKINSLKLKYKPKPKKLDIENDYLFISDSD